MNSGWNFKVWTTEQTNKLKDMWSQACSPRLIADTLGFNDVAAVMTKAEHLGLYAGTKADASLHDLVHKRGEPGPLTDADGWPYTLANARDNQCRWMSGPPTMDSPICGHPVKRKSWCAHHHKRVFVRAGW